jgi:hypothetical protein
MALVILGVPCIAYGLYILLKKQVWISNEYSDGYLATGCTKDIWGVLLLIIGTILIIWGINLK